VEAGQGVQGSTAGDPATIGEVAAPFFLHSHLWQSGRHRPTTPKWGRRQLCVGRYGWRGLRRSDLMMCWRGDATRSRGCARTAGGGHGSA
jgi:hypothetical protein